MVRNFVLASALAAAGFAAAPGAASAGDFYIGVGGPGYGGYYAPVDHRYGHRWGGRPYYGYGGGGYYAPRPRYYGYRPYRPACKVVTVRSWNGYRYVTRTRETCGRSYSY